MEDATGIPITTLAGSIVEAARHLGLRRLAVGAFEAIGARDVSRVDFRLGTDGRPYLLEINTLPGMNPAYSDLTLVAHGEGMSYDVLINEILNLAARRYGLR